LPSAPQNSQPKKAELSITINNELIKNKNEIIPSPIITRKLSVQNAFSELYADEKEIVYDIKDNISINKILNNSSNNELPKSENSNHYSLFDQVLNKVQEKNKGKHFLKSILIDKNEKNKTNRKFSTKSISEYECKKSFDNMDITLPQSNLNNSQLEGLNMDSPRFQNNNSFDKKQNDNLMNHDSHISILKEIDEMDKNITNLSLTYQNYGNMVNEIINNTKKERFEDETNESSQAFSQYNNNNKSDKFVNHEEELEIDTRKKKIVVKGKSLNTKEMISFRDNTDSHRKKCSNMSQNKNSFNKSREMKPNVNKKVYESDVNQDDEDDIIFIDSYDLDKKKNKMSSTKNLRNDINIKYEDSLLKNRNLNSNKKNDYIASQDTIFTFKQSKTKRYYLK